MADRGIYKHLLIATNGSELAQKAEAHGLASAKSVGAEVTNVTATQMWSVAGMTLKAHHAEPHPIEVPLTEFQAQPSNVSGQSLAEAMRVRGIQMTVQTAIKIAIADDDEDDRMLIEEAFQEIRLVNPRVYAKDGAELMEYLETECRASGGLALPGLILLDLNMPRLDGSGVLARLKEHPRLRRIPVVVLTTSKAEEDIYRTYDLGVNSFITKPVSFDDLADTVRTLTHYWVEIVHLPDANAA